MIQMNEVKVIGRLTGNADIRSAGSTPVASFSLAVDDGYYDNAKKEWVDRTVFVDCAAFGRTVETMEKEGISKGTPVFLTGKLQLDRWEKDGKNFQKITVRAAKVQRLHSQPKQSAPHPADTMPHDAIPFA